MEVSAMTFEALIFHGLHRVGRKGGDRGSGSRGRHSAQCRDPFHNSALRINCSLQAKSLIQLTLCAESRIGPHKRPIATAIFA